MSGCTVTRSLGGFLGLILSEQGMRLRQTKSFLAACFSLLGRLLRWKRQRCGLQEDRLGFSVKYVIFHGWGEGEACGSSTVLLCRPQLRKKVVTPYELWCSNQWKWKQLRQRPNTDLLTHRRGMTMIDNTPSHRCLHCNTFPLWYWYNTVYSIEQEFCITRLDWV